MKTKNAKTVRVQKPKMASSAPPSEPKAPKARPNVQTAPDVITTIHMGRPVEIRIGEFHPDGRKLLSIDNGIPTYAKAPKPVAPAPAPKPGPKLVEIQRPKAAAEPPAKKKKAPKVEEPAPEPEAEEPAPKPAPKSKPATKTTKVLEQKHTVFASTGAFLHTCWSCENGSDFVTAKDLHEHLLEAHPNRPWVYGVCLAGAFPKF